MYAPYFQDKNIFKTETERKVTVVKVVQYLIYTRICVNYLFTDCALQMCPLLYFQNINLYFV